MAALWIGGIPFDYIGLTREEFAANKAAGKYPFGQVPVMYVDGECIPQSNAMARYAGRLAGLYPEDPLQAFRVDAIIDTIDDVINAVVATFTLPEAQVKGAREKVGANEIPKLLKYLTDILDKNGGKFLVGDKLTLADLDAMIVVQHWFGAGLTEHLPTFVVTENRAFQSYVEGLKELDAVKNYLSKLAEHRKQ